MVSVELLLIVSACQLIATFSTGLSGFGGAIIFQMLWAVLAKAGVDDTGDLERYVYIYIYYF